jgi:hypothetical protein
MVIFLGVIGLAALVSLFAFPPAAIFLIPAMLLAAAFFGFTEFTRRRKQVQDVQHHRAEADSSGVDFTEEDRQSLSH